MPPPRNAPHARRPPARRRPARRRRRHGHGQFRGPRQSIAVTLAALLATVGCATFLPRVGRALNPHAGFFAGWIMLMYYPVGTTSLTVPLGTYLLSFFSDSAANNAHAVAAVGSAFDLVVLVVAALGIKLSARFQWGWAIFEYGLLIGFAIGAVVGIYGHHLHHTVHVAGSWFTIHGAGGFSALVSGCLLAIFLYSGWDTAAYVSEEAKGTQSGRAGVTSVVLLFVLYSVIILASLQAAIVSASRISFAMGRDLVFPSWFGQVSPRHQTPWNATFLFGLLNIALLWAATLIGPIGTALPDIVSTLGLIAAMFYLLTAGTAVWFYRRTLTSSVSTFIIGGVLPALGAAFMAFVVIYTLATGQLNGVEIGAGFGLAAVGLVLSFVAQRAGHAPFYSGGPEVSDEEPAGPEGS